MIDRTWLGVADVTERDAGVRAVAEEHAAVGVVPGCSLGVARVPLQALLGCTVCMHTAAVHLDQLVTDRHVHPPTCK